MKKNSEKKYSLKYILITNILIFIFIGLILYKFLPFVLNYPPNTIDNQFQLNLVGIKYTHQYIILFSVLILVLYISLRFVLGKLSFKNMSTSTDDINKIRKKCFNYPYFMLLFQAFVPTILAAILLIAFKTEFELLLRLTILIFSFTTLFAIISYMINKQFFVHKLIDTSNLSNDTANSMKLNIYKKLYLQLIPLFLYSFVLLLLLMTSIMTTEKGDLLYHFYREELIKTFDASTTYTLDNVETLLKNIGLKNERDHIFIFSADNGEVYFSTEPLNDFFTTYTLNYYNNTNGHSYDYYGQNTGGAVIKLSTDSGDFFVGIRYYVFSSSVIAPFIVVALLLIVFNSLFVIYIGKDLSRDISSISSGLELISHSEDITNSKALPITSNDEIGSLTIAFNDIQRLTKQNIEQIKDNQSMLMEKERLASLGQMIGGIAHNLKTPIMSLSGAAEGLKELTHEYDISIGDPEVTNEDHHEIVKDMDEWIKKIREYTEYMSDVITAVKGQAVAFSNEANTSFTIQEVVKYVDVLMKHELKNALVSLNVNVNVPESISINGNINSLVQVINNMISNAIQAYNGKPDNHIDFTITLQNNNINFIIQDYGAGIPQSVQNKLFKEMITTKGKNGTGLGLFMSYSNIRAHFNGDIDFESKEGKGTKFIIIIPVN